MHDVVVVGGGGSGVPLAVRLAQYGASVLLLEDGPTSRAEIAGFAHRPVEVLGAQPGHATVRVDEAALTGDRRSGLTRGRVLGGSTAVNGGYFVRARRDDFDRWSTVGGQRWSYEAALPLLRRLETDLVHGATTVHGGDGPMPVARTSLDHPACTAMLAAARSLGLPWEEDKNDQRTPGIGSLPTNVAGDLRVSTAAGYLGTGVPDGLDIRGNTHVLRVRIDRRRAVGVETAAGLIPAARVVLSAGAIGSAHLLLLSGIGPAEKLHRIGVDPVADLPVGTAVSNHPQVVVDWPISRPLPTPTSWLGTAIHATSANAAHEGDLELLQALLPMRSLVAGSTDAPGLSLLVADMTPVNRGSLQLMSADPDIGPRIDLGYLRDAADRAVLRHGVRLAVALFTSGAFDTSGDGIPAAVVQDDAALDRWIAERLGTSMHLCSTAPMGEVVTADGAVYGLDGLHVADTGILPAAPLRGPANTAVLVGELIADALTDR